MNSGNLRLIAQPAKSRVKRRFDNPARIPNSFQVDVDEDQEESLTSLVRLSGVSQFPSGVHASRSRSDDLSYLATPNNQPKAETEEPKSEKPKDAMREAQAVLSDKLSLDLPMDELNSQRINSGILLETVEYSIENLEDSLRRTEDEMEKIQQRFSSIVDKTRKMEYTSSVIEGKLSTLDEWMESIDIDTHSSYIGMGTIQILIGLFSLVTTLFGLLWSKMRRNRQ